MELDWNQKLTSKIMQDSLRINRREWIRKDKKIIRRKVLLVNVQFSICYFILVIWDYNASFNILL